MSAPRLSLVMGGSTQAIEGGDVQLPLPEAGAIHLHLHVGGVDRAPEENAGRRSLGGWAGLIGGVALMAAFAGGYQVGHRPAPDDVSNLRPMPTLGSMLPPEPTMPSAGSGLQAIQRQLASPPQIVPPVRGAPQAAPVPTLPAPAAVPATSAPGRNAFGLEN